MKRIALALLTIAALSASAPGRESLANIAPRKTVAVLYFDNYTGRADYDPLGKGIATMMITDLSSVQEIQIVERDRLQDLVKEIDNQGTKYFDSTTAVKVGKLTGAQYVVVGAVGAVQPQIRIDTRVVKVETGEIVKSAQVTGKEDQFFELEQKLSQKLIDGLALALSPEEQQLLKEKQEQNRINDLSTILSFSQALAYQDRGDYVNAVLKLEPVLRAAPGSSIVKLTYDAMKLRAQQKMQEKANEKIKSGIGKLFGRP